MWLWSILNCIDRALFAAEWLNNGTVQKLILVIKGTESGETLERWVFDVECKQKENAR
jgi:3-deoxy-D-arabino-heptulosonate 7-phosphate (DAHP) synthase